MQKEEKDPFEDYEGIIVEKNKEIKDKKEPSEKSSKNQKENSQKEEFQEYEESLTTKSKKNELDFDVDFNKYDHSGKAMQDLDLYPIKDAIPKRDYPREISDEEFFGEDNSNSKEFEKKKNRYLER